MNSLIDRRSVLHGAAALGGYAVLTNLMPAWAQTGTPGIAPAMPTVAGERISLSIDETPFSVGGRTGRAITINGVLPAPLVRLREGQLARLDVTNNLAEDSSIHWHGLLLPFQMDGVPGLSFPGIAPGETYHYEFPVRQAGTYWYHSHSGLQEQLGHYGPIIIDPAEPDPVLYDREHVVVLSDWSFDSPDWIMGQLKRDPGHFNRQQQTLAGLLAGEGQTIEQRLMWGEMRMDPTDISDVTAATYSYLLNGHGSAENWTGLFEPGERVRLRIINASAMTVFNVRIPGLPMTVVNADGENVRPVDVDELQISVAETYDVVVTPAESRAYTLVGESVDRSGMVRGTLAPRLGMEAEVPPLRERPTLTMADMGMAGMAHGGSQGMGRESAGHDMNGMDRSGGMAGMDHGSGSMDQSGSMSGMDHGSGGMAGMDQSGGMGGMGHGSGGMGGMDMRNPANAPEVDVNPGVDMIAPMPMDRTGDRGLGLENVDHRVLVYTDLVALEPNPDPRPPSRSLEIHLTGNMERFMWSFDGRRFSEVIEPIRFARNERVRVTLVNNTMMQHPIHLHGHFIELVNGHPGRHPRKHTINVLPGGKASFDLTADAPGDWAFHCHLLYHMHAGMFNVVTVRPLEGEAA